MHRITCLVAAEVKLEWLVQTGAWVVLLEGWCRVYIGSTLKEGQQSFLVVSVEQVGPSKEARFVL